MRLPKRKLGQLGEQQAKKYLKNKGYFFIAQNFQTKFGEIDLVFSSDNQIVFVEVKTRSSDFMGLPEEAITPKKIRHLKKAIDIFYLKHPKLSKFARIDAVSITGNEIRHIKNITQ